MQTRSDSLSLHPALYMRFTLCLFTLLVLCVALMLVVGRLRSPFYGPIFTLPNGEVCRQACLFGVSPGNTKAQNAAKMLRSHPWLRQFELVSTQPFRIEGHNDWIMMVSFNATPDGIVDEITIVRYIRYGRPVGEAAIPLPDPGTLGDALSEFGSPDFVQVTTGGDPSLIFARAGVITNLIRTRGEAGRIGLRQPLSRLTLFRYDSCSRDAFDFAFLPWLGATQLRRYAFSYSVHRTVRSMNSAGASFAPCQH